MSQLVDFINLMTYDVSFNQFLLIHFHLFVHISSYMVHGNLKMGFTQRFIRDQKKKVWKELLMW